MIDAVFISDLHLHPQQPEIFNRFKRFTQWAALHTKTVYILGDFFHVWAGDDSLDLWSESVAKQLSWLSGQGVSIFYIHGNRDFLLGKHFAQKAAIQLLSDPHVLNLNGVRVLLTHGDQYCTLDRSHQWLRRLTRNRIFSFIFLCIPLKKRLKLVSHVRERSQNNKEKPASSMDIVPAVMLNQMLRKEVDTVIHGHIHKPGITKHVLKGKTFKQYVLSDWDDNPQILCYYITNGFCFIPLN